jgi:hypothetical protein
MKKWIMGLACVAMGATVAMGQVATLPISESYTATQDWTALTGWSGVSMGTYVDGRAQFNANNDSLTVNFNAAPGTLTFDIKGNTATTGTAPMQFVAEESADGSIWSQIVSIDETQINASSYTTFGPYTLNNASRYVRWTYVNKYGFNIGLNNVYITAGGPAVFSVSLDKTDGFTVEQGTQDTITATGQNGAEPYSYEWETDMAEGDYTASGATFTILSSAAVGNYYARVRATDDESATDDATVNFSVIAPPDYYAITITPPVNGSVTTTPESEAAEASTVTVNATANSGYAVGTITVTAADSSNVPVSGNTFTMPSQDVTVTVTFVEFAAGTYVVDFEGDGETKTSYASGTVTLSEIDWDMTEAMIGTLEADWKNGARSGRMRGYAASSMTMLEDLAGGVGTLSFNYRRYGTDSQVDWKVEYSTDGGGNWAQVGSDFTAPASDEVQTFSEAINSSGNTRIRIKRATETGASNARLNIDDITMTSGGPAVFGVNLDKSNGFTVEQGTQDTITATAQNGAAPYSYDWDTDMAEGDYTASGATFTILSSAAVGNYYATVTATDAESETAEKTVTFSVVEPVAAEGIVDFRFNEAPYLQVTAKDANLTVSDMTLTAGTIETAITTGTYFPDEPYIEETGWTASSQAEAKAFIFTITPGEGAAVTIEGISFNAYATAAGPSAFGFDINGVATYEVDAPSASLLSVSQAVAGVVSETGAIEVKIQGWLNGSRESSGTGVFRLDDVVIHGSVSTGPLEFSVNLNKSNGFTVEQGTQDAITATAVNGAGPYGYTWDTDMTPGDYSADGNVFTILSTAAVGNYYATVTATDAESETAEKTVTFSVVTPPQKYAISIVTNSPANGTVTTTPATEAAEGVSVTVNAVPGDGFAVESIVVNGGAVAVTGNAFVMPAEPVIVTVNFMVQEAPDALITFETDTLSTSYADNTAVLEDGKLWATRRVVRGNLANDKKIGARSSRLYPVTTTNAYLEQTEAYAEPITKLSFWVASYGTDNMANVVLQVQVSSNGETWDTVKTLSGAADITAELVEHVIETIPEGAVYVRFFATAEAASNKRINLDNIGVFHGEMAPYLTYTGSPAGTVGVQMALDFTLHGAEAADWAWGVVNADREPVVGAEGTSREVRWTPSAAGAYYLTVTAYDSEVQVIAQREVTLTVAPVDPGQPAVTFTGSLTGTVGVRLELTLGVTNTTLIEFQSVTLKDPLGVDIWDWDYSNFPPIFAFTFNQAGNWTLTAVANTTSGIISNTVTLVISEGGGGDERPPIPAITFIAGTGFSFELPAGHTVARVQGADAAVAGDVFAWTDLSSPADYEVVGTQVTIKSAPQDRRLIRVVFNVTP